MRDRLKALERENRELRQAHDPAPGQRRILRRRSSTAGGSQDRLHRRSPRRLWGRADLPPTYHAHAARRPVEGAAARPARRGPSRAHPTGPGAERRGRWRAQGMAAARPRRDRGRPLRGGEVPGAAPRPSSTPPAKGWTGSITAACWSPSATSRLPKPKRATAPNGRASPWRRRTQTHQPPANPVRFKVLGASELARNKADRLDAALIARFCRAQTPAAWMPPAPRLRELRELVRRCDALKAARVQELNRQRSGVRLSRRTRSEVD
jgi:hypothetical protein